jgi:hypothetical protein
VEHCKEIHEHAMNRHVENWGHFLALEKAHLSILNGK